MKIKVTIERYLKGLEARDYDKIIQLFSHRAIVNSPLYGKMNAKNFYKELFKDTAKSKITLLNVFKYERPLIAAAHFRYDWVLKDGSKTSFMIQLKSEALLKK